MADKRKGGFYHDGRFATLLDAVNHYNAQFNLQLTEDEKNNLVAFAKDTGKRVWSVAH